MISVGSRDVRERLDFGLEMEEAELEEGEARGYQNNGDGDSTIDPDIALSYIDVKLYNVLGHFQKDFEGGVSAENLGAKFGGYGSFLPTYQRSPSSSFKKSPAEVHNYDPSKSPRKDQRQNTFAPSQSSPSGKAVPVGNPVEGKGYLQSNHIELSRLKSEAIKKSINPTDHRTLKVRIKVGSENLLTQKNFDLYSGFGLVVSPSSSLDESPTTGVGICGELLHAPEESPTSILQIMTSYPGELLLSPLSEDLIHLSEKVKLGGKYKTKLVDSVGRVNGFHSRGSNEKVSELRKLKLNGKDHNTAMANQKNNGNKDNTASLLKGKDIDVDDPCCDELVSNTLKLPLLSSSQHSIPEHAKGVSIAAICPLSTVKDLVKGEAQSTCTEKDVLDDDSDQEIGRTEKLGKRVGSSGKFSESKKANIVSNIGAFPRVDTPKVENSYALNHPESNVSVARKGLTASETELSKQLHKGSANGEGLKPDFEKSSTGLKKNQEVAQTLGTQGVCIEKDESIVKPSWFHKGGKISHANSLVSENDTLHLNKDVTKPGNRYKDFGEVEFEDDEKSISGEGASAGRLKDPQIFEKRSINEDHNTLKYKCNGKTAGKPLPSEKDMRVDSRLASCLGKTLHHEVPAKTVPLDVENWVHCDNCQTWRLLPLGTDPVNLPRKWDCRMLNWLPGMNHCGIPETETTSALRAIYNHSVSVPASAAESQQIAANNAAVTSAGVPSVDARCPDQEHQAVTVHSVTINVKKKHGSAKAANSADLDGSTHSPDSGKILATFENPSNLNSGNCSPSLDACGYQHMPRLSRAANKIGENEKEKISHTKYSGKDAILTTRSKREADMEGSRAYKRCKSEELHFDDELWNPDNGGTSSNKGIADDDLLHAGEYSKESYRKRKAKESHNSVIHTEPVSSSGRHRLDSGDFVEELPHHKEKKARVSKSGGKNTSGSKTNDKTDRRSKDTKDHHNGQYLSISPTTNCLNTRVITGQPTVAANSSSSKVSSSHKNKHTGYEIRGSPVESMSSSPLTFPIADKVASTRKNINEKDDFNGSGFITGSSSRSISGGEDEGWNDQTGAVEKDRIITVSDHVHDGYGSSKNSSNKCKVEDSTHADQCENKGLLVKKSGKDLFSDSKDEVRTSGPDSDKVNSEVSDSHDFLDHMHLHAEKLNHGVSKFDQKLDNPNKGERVISKNDTARGSSSKSSKGQSQKKLGHDRQDVVKSQDKKHDLRNDHEDVKLPKKSNGADVCGSGKSNSLPPLARCQPEKYVSGSQKENRVTALAVDNGDTQRASNQRKRAETPSNQPARHPTPTSQKVRDVEASSPLRRDSSSHAANKALKEAKDLKHSADRLKNSESNESIGLYFQAALKFLHGASLLESGSSEATKHNELMHSVQIYSSTAKLCEFCAREYEKSKDMAAASLAYKCVEVAYMRVVYSSHNRASRDRNELQTALQIVPSGESPSSSASDVDNLNHQASTERASLARVVGSPQVSGNLAITSQNRSGLLRILSFAQDVTLAMEASRKSRIAFMAATSRLDETSPKERISSLKKALDFNYQDVDSLLHLVRVAMEAISR